MSLLIILFFIAIWIIALFGAAYVVTFPLQQRKGIRGIAIVLLMGVGFTLPIRDEIKGAEEFDALCAVGNVYQIPPWAEGKNFDLKMNASPYKRLVGYARPVDERTITYTDKATGGVVATAKAYVAHGGWLVRKIGYVLMLANGAAGINNTIMLGDLANGGEALKINQLIGRYDDRASNDTPIMVCDPQAVQVRSLEGWYWTPLCMTVHDPALHLTFSDMAMASAHQPLIHQERLAA